MPTAAERAGDFSNSRQPNGTLIQVRDPLQSGTVFFPGNMIPANRINKQGQILLNVFALPNFSNAAVSQGNYNYTFQTNPVTDRIGHVFRIDYRPNSTDSIYFRGQRTLYETNGSPLVGNWEFVFQKTGTRNKNGVIGWTHVFSPSMVNEFYDGRPPPARIYGRNQRSRFPEDPQLHSRAVQPGD